MAEVWTMGELLCEIMRPEAGAALGAPGVFLGPFPSGAPAIFANTVARLGHTAGIVGGVGRDDFGRCLLDRLTADGVDCSHVAEYDDGSTGVAFVTYLNDSSRRFLFHFSDTPATRPTAPPISAFEHGTRFFHIMGCSLMAKAAFGREILRLMYDMAGSGAKISFDPNIRPELLQNGDAGGMVREVLERCSVLMPGVAELSQLAGESAPARAVEAMFRAYPLLEIIALKDGARGCTLYTRGTQVSLGVYRVDAKDATGAGDCFDGALLCGLLEGKSLAEAGRMAAAAAALNTAAFGPMEGAVTRQAIERLMAEQTPR